MTDQPKTTSLAEDQVWIPAAKHEQKYTRTILFIRGQQVDYVSEARGEIDTCRVETFRQWVSKMRSVSV
jgi:hypothetical protein